MPPCVCMINTLVRPTMAASMMMKKWAEGKPQSIRRLHVAVYMAREEAGMRWTSSFHIGQMAQTPMLDNNVVILYVIGQCRTTGIFMGIKVYWWRAWCEPLIFFNQLRCVPKCKEYVQSYWRKCL